MRSQKRDGLRVLIGVVAGRPTHDDQRVVPKIASRRHCVQREAARALDGSTPGRHNAERERSAMKHRGAAEDGQWAAQVEQLEPLEDDEGNPSNQPALSR